MGTRVRLADLLAGLSGVADLGFGLPAGSALRACALATALARQRGLAEAEVSAVYYTALLQHVGCVGFAHETARLFGDELTLNGVIARTDVTSARDVVTSFLPELTRGRGLVDKARLTVATFAGGERFGIDFATAACEVGRVAAGRIGLPESVQEGLYHVYEQWDGRGAPAVLVGDAIPLPSRLARLAGFAATYDRIGGTDLAITALDRMAGRLLDPALVASFRRHASSLLDELNATDARDLVLAAEPKPWIELDDEELAAAATAFGDLADLKSPFLHGHSAEVAGLAHGAALRLGLSDGEVRQLTLAATLHDLGRVAVSNVVWERPRSLGRAEWEQVRLHAYHSERILAGSPALAAIAAWAGRHHERLNGSGYHRGCGATELPTPVRVLAVADAYQAMTHARPHRQALPIEEAAALLRADGGYDPEAVEAVLHEAGHVEVRIRRARPDGLSERELEVLSLVARGCSNKEIARRLGISRRTAEHHVAHIYDKVGVTSRAAAALYAMEHGLLGDG